MQQGAGLGVQIQVEARLRNDEISLNSVDLPAPFGPMTERICCSSTPKLTLLTAVRPPNFLVIPLTSRIAAIAYFRLTFAPRLNSPLGSTSMSTIMIVE